MPAGLTAQGTVTHTASVVRWRTALVGLLLVAGCSGGGQQEAAKPAAQVLADAQAAATAAGTVHVQGTVPAQGESVPVDLSVGPQGATGTGSFAGTTVQLIRTGDSIYVRGAEKVLGRFLGPAAEAKAAGHWVQVPVTLPQLSQLAGLTDYRVLVPQLLLAGPGLKKDGTRTVRGRKVVVLSGLGASGKATLLVAATGTPYPVERAEGSNSVTLSRWKEPVPVAAPGNAVPLSALLG